MTAAFRPRGAARKIDATSAYRMAHSALLIAASWAGVAALLTLQGWLTGVYAGEALPLWPAFGYSLAIASIWAMMTPALLALGARLRRERPPLTRAGAALAAGYGAAALFHVLAFTLVFWPIYGAGQHETLQAMAAHMIVRNVGLNALFFTALIVLGRLRGSPPAPATVEPPVVPPETLHARSRGRVRLIRLSSIRWIRAAGNHAEAVTDDGATLLDESLAALGRRLPSRAFVRVHRTAIVRLSAVTEVRSRGHGDADLLLESGDLVRLSRRYRAALTDLLPRP